MGYLSDLIIDYLRLSQYERLQLRNTMTRNSVDIDWREMVKEYLRAFDYAASRILFLSTFPFFLPVISSNIYARLRLA